MKLKPILISVFLLAVIALAGWWFAKRSAEKKEIDERIGNKLLSPELMEKASEIALREPALEETVLLRKEPDNTWILPDYYNLPVDFSKLESFTRSLLDADVLRLVTKNPERLERLELGENKIELKSSSGEILWSMETGKRGPSGGRFVRFGDEKAGYLADLSLYFDTDKKNWARKKLLAFEPNKVESVMIDFPEDDNTILLTRETAEKDFLAEGLEGNQSIDDSQAESLVRNLLNARFDAVKTPDDPDALAALDHSREIELILFNGENYSLKIGRKPPEPKPVAEEKVEEKPAASEPEKEGAAVEAEDGGTVTAEAGPEETETAPASPGEEKKEEPEMTDPGPVFIFFSSSNPEDRINGIMDRIALTFPEYTYNQINTALDKLIKTSATPEKKEGPAAEAP